MKLFKHLGLMFVLFFAALQLAFAIDVNTADAAALDSVKDIGPKTAAKIIDERSKNGPFKDWDDLITRVKGIGPKNSDTMSAGGLTVNGKAKPNAPAAKAAAPSPATPSTMAAKPVKTEPAGGPANAAGSSPSRDGAGTASATDGEAKTAKHRRTKKDKTGKADGAKSDAPADAAGGTKAAADAGDAAKPAHKKRSKKDKAKAAEADKDAGKPADAEAGKTGK